MNVSHFIFILKEFRSCSGEFLVWAQISKLPCILRKFHEKLLLTIWLFDYGSSIALSDVVFWITPRDNFHTWQFDFGHRPCFYRSHFTELINSSILYLDIMKRLNNNLIYFTSILCFSAFPNDAHLPDNFINEINKCWTLSSLSTSNNFFLNCDCVNDQ